MQPVSTRKGFTTEEVWVLNSEQEFEAKEKASKQRRCYVAGMESVTKAHLCLEKTEYSEDSLTWGL